LRPYLEQNGVLVFELVFRRRHGRGGSERRRSREILVEMHVLHFAGECQVLDRRPFGVEADLEYGEVGIAAEIAEIVPAAADSLLAAMYSKQYWPLAELRSPTLPS
jgi:hypothetical protein